jgi:DNA polymerase-3 subunit alpha
LALEKETTGLYLSGHPLAEYEELIAAVNATEISRIHKAKNADGQLVTVVGIITGKKSKTTKSGGMMAFADLEDKTGTIELIIFPKIYEQYGAMVAMGSVVVIRGRTKGDREEGVQITCDMILGPDEARVILENTRTNRAPVYDRQPPPEAYNTPIPPENTRSEPAKKAKRSGLYLKFPAEGSPLVQKASNVLFVFEGDFPVYFYYGDKAKYVQCPRTYWIAPNDVMIGELRRILGEGNVALIGSSQFTVHSS